MAPEPTNKMFRLYSEKTETKLGVLTQKCYRAGRNYREKAEISLKKCKAASLNDYHSVALTSSITKFFNRLISVK